MLPFKYLVNLTKNNQKTTSMEIDGNTTQDFLSAHAEKVQMRDIVDYHRHVSHLRINDSCSMKKVEQIDAFFRKILTDIAKTKTVLPKIDAVAGETELTTPTVHLKNISKTFDKMEKVADSVISIVENIRFVYKLQNNTVFNLVMTAMEFFNCQRSIRSDLIACETTMKTVGKLMGENGLIEPPEHIIDIVEHFENIPDSPPVGESLNANWMPLATSNAFDVLAFDFDLSKATVFNPDGRFYILCCNRVHRTWRPLGYVLDVIVGKKFWDNVPKFEFGEHYEVDFHDWTVSDKSTHVKRSLLMIDKDGNIRQTKCIVRECRSFPNPLWNTCCSRHSVSSVPDYIKQPLVNVKSRPMIVSG